MKINPQKIFLILKIAVVAFCVLILCFLFAQKFVFSKNLVYEIDFIEKNQQNKFVRGFFPETRIEFNENNIKVNHEPIYLEVYSPRKYKQAKVKIKYQNQTDLNAQFGVKLKNNDWAFFMQTLQNTDDSFIESEFELDLANAEIINNKLKFILACPRIDQSENKIIIESIKINLN